MEDLEQPLTPIKPFRVKGMGSLDQWYTEDWLRQQAEAETRQLCHSQEWWQREIAEMMMNANQADRIRMRGINAPSVFHCPFCGK